MAANDPAPILKLDYPSAGSPRENHLRKWLEKCPFWLLALLLLLPVLACNWLGVIGQVAGRFGRISDELPTLLYIAVLFVPGSIKRLNWRHLLVMLALAGAWYGVGVLPDWTLAIPIPYSLIFWVLLPMAMVGGGEWLLRRPRRWPALAWLLALCFAAACLLPLIHQPLRYLEQWVWIPRIGGGGRYGTTWAGIAYWPLLVGLTWLAVPAGLRLGAGASRRGRIAAANITIILPLCFAYFFWVLVYQLAERSLITGGPFGRSYSAMLLEENRGNRSHQALWTALEQADWSAPRDPMFLDYRRTCIDVLERLDRQAAADGLSKMLRDRPSLLLAQLSAKLLGDEQRHDAVAVLLRYAMLGDGDCAGALDTMKFDEQPTPLSEADAAEAERVRNAMSGYWAAFDRLDDAKGRLFERRAEADGLGNALALLDRKHQQPTNSASVPNIPPATRSLLNRHWEKALADMAVAAPDWNVAGTEALEREVQKHAERVDAMIASFEGDPGEKR